MLRRRSRRQRIFAILMLLGLLFQVQTVLACQMMETPVPVDHCCCEGMAQKATDKLNGETSSSGQKSNIEQKTVQADPRTDDSCCEFGAELTLKEPDLGRDLPAIVQSVDGFDLPETSAYLLLAAIWPEEQAASRFQISRTYSPQLSLPGTKTYLSTQRLRI